MFKLERVTGPECPDCGCQDSEVVQQGDMFGAAFERRRCSHCGRVFSGPLGAVSDRGDGRPARPRKGGRWQAPGGFLPPVSPRSLVHPAIRQLPRPWAGHTLKAHEPNAKSSPESVEVRRHPAGPPGARSRAVAGPGHIPADALPGVRLARCSRDQYPPAGPAPPLPGLWRAVQELRGISGSGLGGSGAMRSAARVADTIARTSNNPAARATMRPPSNRWFRGRDGKTATAGRRKGFR